MAGDWQSGGVPRAILVESRGVEGYRTARLLDATHDFYFGGSLKDMATPMGKQRGEKRVVGRVATFTIACWMECILHIHVEHGRMYSCILHQVVAMHCV
jgi:hypothetical protein